MTQNEALLDYLVCPQREALRLAIRALEARPKGKNGEAIEVVQVTNEEARIHFRGICPYTSVACGWWQCSKCEVEKREREWTHKIDEDDE